MYIMFSEEMNKEIFGHFIWTYLAYLVGSNQASYATAWLISNNSLVTLLNDFSTYSKVEELAKIERVKDPWNDKWPRYLDGLDEVMKSPEYRDNPEEALMDWIKKVLDPKTQAINLIFYTDIIKKLELKEILMIVKDFKTLFDHFK